MSKRTYIEKCMGNESDPTKRKLQKLLAKAELLNDEITDTNIRHLVSEKLVQVRLTLRGLNNGN